MSITPAQVYSRETEAQRGDDWLSHTGTVAAEALPMPRGSYPTYGPSRPKAQGRACHSQCFRTRGCLLTGTRGCLFSRGHPSPPCSSGFEGQKT